MSEPESISATSWASRAFHALLVAAVLIVVGLRVYGYFAGDESRAKAPAEPTKNVETRDLRVVAYEALRDKDWAVAAEAYGELANQDPDEARVRIRLAYSLLNNKQYDEALGEFLHIARINVRVKQWALLNIARIYAAKQERQLALYYLSEAVAEGHRVNESIVDDAEFSGLRDDPEFLRLAELLLEASQRDKFHRFDFLVGQWSLIDEGDHKIGTITFSKGVDNFSISGVFNDEVAAYQTTIHANYDLFNETWRQTWISSRQGEVMEVHEVTQQQQDDRQLVLAGFQKADGEQEKRLARITFTESETGLFQVKIESSRAEDDTWRELLCATMVPLGTKSNDASN